MIDINETVRILGGQLRLPNISNNTGTVALISTEDGETLVTRTKEQFISDYNLATVANLANNYTPKTRLLTINGNAQDLSTDRIWTIDTKSNLSLGSITDASITINNSNGTGILLDVANQTQAGLLSSSLYNKIMNTENALGDYVKKTGDTMSGILSAPSFKWTSHSDGPIGVVTEKSVLNNIGSSFAYGIGTNLNGGFDIMSNQAGFPIRMWAGGTNDTPILSATFLAGDLSVPNRIYSGTGANNQISTYLGAGAINTIVNGHEYKWYDDVWRVGNRRGGSSNTIGYSIELNGDEKFGINSWGSTWIKGDLTVIGGTIYGEAPTGNYPLSHALKLGGVGRDEMNFYEYGGVFNFYKSRELNQDLLVQITELGNIITKNFGSANQWNDAVRDRHRKDLQAGIENASDIRANTSWFDYNWAGTRLLGSVINFSGLSNEGYNTELFGQYDNNGNNFFLRTKNGDTNKWNLHRRIWTDGDYTDVDVNNWKLAARASHVHDNKTLLDAINQNLSTTSSPIFNGIQIGYITGPFKGFNSTQSFSFLNAGNAQTISTGGVLISDDYQDTTFIPVNGMYSKGTISTKTHGNSSLWKMAYDLSLANIALDGLVFDGTTLKVNAIGKEVFEKTTQGGLRVIDWNSSASALNAIAIGAGANAGAFNSFAMMNGASASGNSAIAFGLQSISSASHSVSLGNYTSSLAPYGAVLGYGSTNTQAGCTVVGNFSRPLQNEVEISTTNTSDKPIFIIGNGISSTIRSNSHEFFRDGSTKNYGRQYYDEATRHLIDFTKDNTLVDVEYVKNNGGGGLPKDPWGVLINDFDYAGDVIENPEITAASGGQYPIYYMLEGTTQGDNVWSPWDNGGIQNATGLMFGYYIESKKLMLIRGYINDPSLMISPHNSSSLYIEYIQNQDIYTSVNVAYASFVKYRDIKLGNIISGNKHILYFNPK